MSASSLHRESTDSLIMDTVGQASLSFIGDPHSNTLVENLMEMTASGQSLSSHVDAYQRVGCWEQQLDSKAVEDGGELGGSQSWV